MSEIVQKEVGELKVGSYVVFDGGACRVTNIDKSTPGKHGHAKYRITAVNLISGNKKVVMLSGHAKVDAPIIEKKNAQVLSIEGNKASVMDMESYETLEVEIDDEVKDTITEGATVLYWNILGKRIIKQVKGKE
jgi:translation initiation factor 5A